MADKVEKLEAKDWISAIESGIDFREKVSDYKRWGEFIKYYEGRYASGIVPVNLIYSNGKIMVPKCYFRNPRVKVIAKQAVDWYKARVVEAVANYLIKELRIKWHIKKMIEDAYLAGIAFCKVGYTSKFGYLPEKEEAEEGGTQTTIEKGEEKKIEFDVNIKAGMPWAGRVEPADIIVPYGSLSSGDPEITDIPWIAHRFIRHIEDAKADKKYDKKAIKELEEKGAKLGIDNDKDPKPDIERKQDYVEFWEIRDYQRGKIYVVVREIENFFVNEDDELGVEGLPFGRLVFNTHPKYFYPISDIKNLEPHQLALNEAYTILKRSVNICLKKLAYETGGLDQAEIDKLTNDVIGELVKTNKSPREVLQEFNFTVPQEIFQAINEYRKTLRELVGYSRNEAGEFDQSTRRTATEANLVKQGSETRSSERRDQVADLLEWIIRKLLQIVFKHWTEEKVIKIVGEEGQQYWVKYTGEEIEGEYDFEINAEDAQVVDTDKLTSDAIALLQQFQDDLDFSQDERKNIKRTLAGQFTHLGFDLAKAFAPAGGETPPMEGPIPLQDFEAKSEQGKRANAAQDAAGGIKPK